MARIGADPGDDGYFGTHGRSVGVVDARPGVLDQDLQVRRRNLLPMEGAVALADAEHASDPRSGFRRTGEEEDQSPALSSGVDPRRGDACDNRSVTR